jgi:hypothetical protein
LTLDRSHISEAERFNCLQTAPLLWKCCLCGRSRWLAQVADIRQSAPEPVEARTVA